jgi:ubiquinone biosynthesis protein Coq4
VRIHDLHHVVAGYRTDLRGEAEIAAWELASGCRGWPIAIVLNLGALGLGAVMAPRRTARAWARGRRTRNLYGERGGIDHLLPRPVDEIRAALGLDRPAPPVRVRDALAVAALGVPAAASIAALAAAPVIAAGLLVAALG